MISIGEETLMHEQSKVSQNQTIALKQNLHSYNILNKK